MKRKKRYANFDDGERATPSSEMNLTTGSSNKNGSNGIWNSLFSNLGGILSGVSDLLGKGSDSTDYPTQYNSDSSSSLGFGSIFLYGGGALILILLLVLFLKK
jgi:hypothetical protein